MICQNKNFKVSLTLFGWKENILYKQHIVHCSVQEGHMVDKVIVFKKLMVGSRSTKGKVYEGHMVDIR